MSVYPSDPQSLASANNYGEALGRGDVEAHVVATLRTWIVAYVADYERQHAIPPRTLPVPPSPSSIDGGIDFLTFSSELFPQIIVVAQPSGTPERYGDGTYGSWFTVEVGAIVTVEGSQDQTRMVADAYGTILQKLIPQQGEFGLLSDGITEFATRTRLQGAYSLVFPDATVRDIMRATVIARTFITGLVDDYSGPRVPPEDPYATPIDLPIVDRVEVSLVRGTPDDFGELAADSVILDATVNPPVTEYEETTVYQPPDTIPSE